MNKLIILICLLASCHSEPKTIYTKDYLPKDKPCICNYAYDNGFGTIWFQDSCNKYNIGDTIK